MSDRQFSLILWRLAQKLVDGVRDTRQIDFVAATKVVMSSQTYAMLADRDNALWQFGAVFLGRVLEREFATGKFAMPDVIL